MVKSDEPQTRSMMRKLLPVSGVILTLFLLLSAAGCQTDRTGRIVFLGPREGRYGNYIYSMNPDGSDRVKLTFWAHSSMPFHNVWSAGGKTLAYIDSDNETERRWLSVVDGNGQNRRRLLDITDLKMNSMALSPDGRTVVLSLDSTRLIKKPQGGTVHVEVAEDTDLFTVDVKTRKLNRLTDTPDVVETLPSYSPDGKQVSFVGKDADEIRSDIPDIYVMDADGGNRRRLVRHLEGEGFYQPELLWSPDSSKIIFIRYNLSISDSEHYTDIFVIDVKAGVLTNLTDSPYIFDGESSWSPDSRKIAFYSGNVTEGYHTLIKDIGSGNLTRLDQGVSSWTPDGKGLIFVNPVNVFELMVVDADGKNPRPLAVSKDVRISMPFWLSE